MLFLPWFAGEASFWPDRLETLKAAREGIA
jgi:hypothetical protein